MSKYHNLSSYLAALTQDEVRLGFSQIAEILGFGLPGSALKYPAWWANQSGDGHSQSASWQAAGWRTQGLDLAARKITFVRESHRPPSPHPDDQNLAPGLTIEQAKSGLATYFGVKQDNIEIIIRG